MSVSNGRRRVVITGLGLISPVGNSVDVAWSNVLAGKSGIATITKFDHAPLSVHFAGEVKDFNVEEYVSAKEARHMDTFIHLTIFQEGRRQAHQTLVAVQRFSGSV